jgi:hypothetical protein
MLEKKGMMYDIPSEFQGKRLEELTWEEMEMILKG